AASRQSGPRAAAASAALLQPVDQRPEAAVLAASAGLVLDRTVSPRNRLEALVRDGIAAHHGDTVGALLEAGFGPLDRLEVLLEILAQGVVGCLLLELVCLVAAVLRLIGRF